MATSQTPDSAEQLVAEFHTSHKSWLCSLKTLLVIVLTIGLAVPILMLRDRSTRYRLTNQRLRITRGVFSRVEDEIELYRVKDLRFEDTLIQRMFGLGDIIVTSSEANAPTVHLRHIRGASALRDTLRGLVETRRAQRGVREYDVA